MTQFINQSSKFLAPRNRYSLLIASLGVLLFWACHLNSSDSQDKFDLVGDSTWTACDRILVELLDEKDKVVDTLFEGSLKSLDQLKGLSAEKYAGGKAKVHISGQKEGGLCFDETRTFDGNTGSVVVDTALAPSAKVQSVSVQPNTLLLKMDEASVSVAASLKPNYAEQAFIWSLDDEKLAKIEFPNGVNNGSIRVKPLAAGTVKILVKSKNDTSKTDELTLKIESPSGASITVLPDTLQLYAGGPGDSLQAKISPAGTDKGVEWTSDDTAIAKVDNRGNVKPGKEGLTRIRAKSTVLSLAGAAVVQVKRDIPVLTVESRSGAAMNTLITFKAKSVQEFGMIVMYKWDLDGDGIWEDSLKGTWAGKIVALDSVTKTYAKEGQVTARFMVRDSEGNEGIASALLSIGNQAPEILDISVDTTISIHDSIPLFAKVKDYEGKVVWAGWDFEGDGKFDDSLTTTDSSVDIISGHKYAKAGDFYAILKVKDDVGKERRDSVKIKVLLDPPVADAGNDTTVLVDSLVRVQAKGKDKYGPITAREIKIGEGKFISLGKQDTLVQPPVKSGSFNIVVRVTDDDGISDEDTMVVTVAIPSLSNSDLKTLRFSAGKLTPEFKRVTTLYTLMAANADSQISVQATTDDPLATLAVNGTPMDTSDESGKIGILVGMNKDAFQLVVTAQNGIQKIYAISVNRAPSAEALLSKLEVTGITLRPVFTTNILNYSDTVSNATTSITLKPTASSPGAKVYVNDINLTSGTASEALPLKVGENTMKVLVVAQDGKTKATYEVKVVRLAKLIVSRKLVLDSGLIVVDSVEAPLGSDVKIEAPAHPAFRFSQWLVLEGTGSFIDSMATPTMVTLKSATVRVQPAYVLNTYILKTSAGPGGTVTPTTIVKHGDSATFTITPSKGYRILEVIADGEKVTEQVLKFKNTYTLKSVTKSHEMSVTFLRTYLLNSNSTNLDIGAIKPELTNVIVDSGTTQTFILGAKTLFKPSLLMDEDKDVTASLVPGQKNTWTYTLTNLKSNHSLKATFGPITFSIVAKAAKGGGIVLDADTIEYGGSFTAEIGPTSGYRVSKVLDNGVDVTKAAEANAFKYTVKEVTANHTLEVEFLKTFTITLEATPAAMGKFDLGKSIVVDSGSKMEFILLAEKHYLVDSLFDDKKNVTKELAGDLASKSAYILADITSDHVLLAKFKPETLTLTVNGNQVCILYQCPKGGFCRPETCPVVPINTTVRTYDYTPTAKWRISTLSGDAKGRQFLYWTINGVIDETLMGPDVLAGPFEKSVIIQAFYLCTNPLLCGSKF